MENLNDSINNFLNNEDAQMGEEVCDLQTGKCYIKTKDGLIERTLIEKKLVIQDGRELLTEQVPISHSTKSYLR